MKKIAISVFILLLGSLTISCFETPSTLPTMTVTETAFQNGSPDSSKFADLQAAYNDLKAKYDTLKSGQISASTPDNDLAGLQSKYDELQAAYKELINSAGQSTLRNPTWAEVNSFVETDDINKVPYNLSTFACSGYATILRDRARRLGWRTAFVQVMLPGTAGHVLNAFQTSDAGLVYIDCTEADKVAYIKLGQPYSMIGIDAVRDHYIDCSGLPKDFYRDLVYKDATGIFSYDYYLEYQQRKAFYDQTIVEYNLQVVAFNEGRGSLSKSQMDAWMHNIDILSDEVGKVDYIPLGTVGNIETYWGDNP